MWSVIAGRTYPTEGRSSNILTWISNHPFQFSPLVGHPDFPIRETLRKMLGLLTVMILKKYSVSIFFHRKRFTAYEIKDRKEVKNSLTVFHLLKIIHPFQGKNHLRT